MSAPNNYRVTNLMAASLKVEADPLKCGLCNEPSRQPLCRKCSAVLNRERFGPLTDTRRERRS